MSAAAIILLTMMNNSARRHSYGSLPPAPSPVPPEKPEPSKYDLALCNMELKEKSKKVSQVELPRQAREFRSRLNELASTEEVRFIRRALKIEGSDYQKIGEKVSYEGQDPYGEDDRAIQLVLTPAGFRVIHERLHKMEDGTASLRWKWTSLMMKLCQGGMNIEKVESWVKEEAKRRLAENLPASKEKKEEVIP